VAPGDTTAPAPGGRLTDWISLGVLRNVISRDDVDEALAHTGRRHERSRLLPAHVVVYFTLAMCLYSDDSYEEVMRKLAAGLAAFRSWDPRWRVPGPAAPVKARDRLGAAPPARLFDRLALPCAGLGTRGAWMFGRRLVAIDGTMLDLPATPADDAAFDRTGNAADAAAFPQALVVALVEVGTRAVVAAEIDSCRAGENAPAARLLGCLEPGWLLLADGNFYSFAAWRQAHATGADLIWRVSASVHLPIARRLPDGSFLTTLADPRARGRRRARLLEAAAIAAVTGTPLAEADAADAAVARVVEYDVPDRPGNGANEVVCVLTTLADPLAAPAADVAACYHERWEEETVLGEIKTYLRGPGEILRSQSPDLVRQEIWALLLTHYAIRRIMTAAADEAGEDPDRLSFTRSLRVVRRQVAAPADFSP
jgi:hypothetical protein